MEKKHLKSQVYLALGSVLAVLVVITAVTFAWFTFNNATNVEPMASTISQGDASLLISNASGGPFDKTCTLVLDSNPETLSPVSTADLTSFYETIAQNRSGISTLYRDVTQQSTQYVIGGTVYLQCTGGSTQVYFLPSALSIGADGQAMAALRLGMVITVNGQATTYIFNLDSLGSGAAEATQTIPTSGTVVASIDGSGNGNYTADPSQSIGDYMAVEASTDNPQPGTSTLCTLGENEIATVQYWLYLEGCDDNCLKSVQSKDLSLQLGFAGTSAGVAQ